MTNPVNCDHCSSPVEKDYILETLEGVKHFCCTGCRGVYKLLTEHDLTSYYHFKDRAGAPNAPVYNSDSFEYLDSKEFQDKYIQSKVGMANFSFFIEGIHCAACLWLLEKLPLLVEGVQTARLNMATSVIDVTYKPEVKLSQIARQIANLGYRPHPLLNDADAIKFAQNEDRKWLIKIAIAFACAGNIMLYSFANYAGAEGVFREYFNLFAFLCSLPVILFCAIPFYQSSWSAIKSGRLSIDIPISVALIAGSALGIYGLWSGEDLIYFDTLSILVFLLLTIRYGLKKIQKKTLASHDLSSFFLAKHAVKLEDDGQKREVLTKFLKIGDQVLVKAGETIPIDGKITKGLSYINNSLLTGEVKPEKVAVGSDVFMGAQNLDQNIVIKVGTTADQSRLGKVLQEIETRSLVETKISALAEQLARRFIFFIFILSGFFFVYFLYNYNLGVAFNRTITLLVITCPCALALTTPLALILGLSHLAKMGVFVKNEFVLEKLADATHIFLDKTGTLTKGEFHVCEVGGAVENKKYWNLLYSLELRGHHPLAASIVDYIETSRSAQFLQLQNFTEIPGVGVRGEFDGRAYEAKAHLLNKNSLVNDGLTHIALFEDGKPVIWMKLSDSLREGAKATVEKLKEYNIIPILLSGDKKDVVDNVGKDLGLATNNVLSEQSPEQKRDIVQKHAKAIMVGDGVNDAVALKSAYVGLAVKGSADVSLRAADVYMSKSGVDFVFNLILAARKVMKIIYINLGISFGYNLVGIYLTFVGVISPLAAAILMPISSVTIILTTLAATKNIRKILG